MAVLAKTQEFRRIDALPKRDPDGFDKSLTEQVTAALKRPEGTQALRHIQAQALLELGEHRGLLGSLRVGAGKTLITLLAPYVLEAKRPILLLPAALREKTEAERRVLAKHWRIPTNLRMISYEELGRENSAKVLDFYRPDLIVADEAHRLKNLKAGVTRRVDRYFGAHPDCVGVFVSGTLIKATIRDFAHLASWAFGESSPMPQETGEVEAWSGVLDEQTNPFQRTLPGPLLEWAEPEDRAEDPPDPFRTARRAFRRRLLWTPGVLSTGQDQVSCSIYVRAVEYEPNAATDENFTKLRGDWETPDGWRLLMAVDVWRHARELALGLHYVWDPRPPDDWQNARKSWARKVREILSRSRTLDTEAQVVSAIDDGAIGGDAAIVLADWRKVKDTFTPNSVPVWHDSTALEVCEAWMKKGPGIVWVEHGFFGEELSRRTGAPFYREGGLDAKGENLQVVAELVKAGKRKAGPIICSQDACSTGYNLQPWYRNLITSCPTNAAEHEQLFGRTHRDGQLKDAVEVDILVGCLEHVEAWERARARARMTEDVMGAPQKILVADVAGFPTVEDCLERKADRWKKIVEKDFDPLSEIQALTIL